MMMMTTTNTTTTNNNNTITTAQQQQRTTTKMRTREQEEMEERLRDRWEDRVTDVLFRQMKRKIRAANAPIDVYRTWFMLHHVEDVTRHAALAEVCLDDARAHAKRKGRALPPLEYLPSGILESEALEPYLTRWKRDNDSAASAAAAAPTRAHCAYPLMD